MPKTPYFPADHAPLIASLLRRNGLSGEDRAEALSDFCNRLLVKNQVMNLTAITEPGAVALKHIADSLALSRFLPEGARLIDVGSGAGFPSVPLAILRPDLRIVALDSTAKRVDFIRTCGQEMGLSNLGGLVGRAEELGRDSNHRERFDVATARAVADLRVLSELCLPLVRVGGRFLAMKGGDVGEECEGALRAISRLGGRLVGVERYALSSEEESIERSVVVVEKVSPTPSELPRGYGAMVKKGL